MNRIAPIVLVALMTGCGGGESRVGGVVIDVEGNLSSVVSFEILTPTGDRLTFVPGPDLKGFRHGGPLTHLSEHLRTGEPIRVTYTETDGGGLIAVIVEDVG